MPSSTPSSLHCPTSKGIKWSKFNGRGYWDHTQGHTQTNKYSNTRTHTQAHAHTRTYSNTHTQTRHIQTHTHTHTYTHIRIHKRKHNKHTHSHTHTKQQIHSVFRHSNEVTFGLQQIIIDRSCNNFCLLFLLFHSCIQKKRFDTKTY